MEDEGGLHDRGGAAGAAAQFDQDLPAFEGGDGAFADAADAGVVAVEIPPVSWTGRLPGAGRRRGDVGRVGKGGAYGETEILASCYHRSLQVADQLGVRRIAFPAIATGVYGFPPERAARIAVDTLISTPTTVTEIRLVAFDETTRDVLAAALDRRTSVDIDHSL